MIDSNAIANVICHDFIHIDRCRCWMRFCRNVFMFHDRIHDDISISKNTQFPSRTLRVQRERPEVRANKADPRRWKGFLRRCFFKVHSVWYYSLLPWLVSWRDKKKNVISRLCRLYIIWKGNKSEKIINFFYKKLHPRQEHDLQHDHTYTFILMDHQNGSSCWSASTRGAATSTSSTTSGGRERQNVVSWYYWCYDYSFGECRFVHSLIRHSQDCEVSSRCAKAATQDIHSETHRTHRASQELWCSLNKAVSVTFYCNVGVPGPAKKKRTRRLQF